MSCVCQVLSRVTGIQQVLNACSCCYYLIIALSGAVVAVPLSPPRRVTRISPSPTSSPRCGGTGFLFTGLNELVTGQYSSRAPLLPGLGAAGGQEVEHLTHKCSFDTDHGNHFPRCHSETITSIPGPTRVRSSHWGCEWTGTCPLGPGRPHHCRREGRKAGNVTENLGVRRSRGNTANSLPRDCLRSFRAH